MLSGSVDGRVRKYSNAGYSVLSCSVMGIPVILQNADGFSMVCTRLIEVQYNDSRSVKGNNAKKSADRTKTV